MSLLSLSDTQMLYIFFILQLVTHQAILIKDNCKY